MFRRKKPTERRPTNQNGKASAPVVRYYTANKPEKNGARVERIKKEDDSTRTARFRNFLSLLPQRLVFITIVFLLFLNTTLSSAELTRVNDQGTTYRSLQAYNNGIDAIFAESLLNKSKLTLDSEAFEAKLKKQFPEIDQAAVVIPLAGRELQINLSFAEPLLLLTTVDNKKGIIGEEGNFILLEDGVSSNFAAVDTVPLLSLQVQPDLQQGSQLLTTTETNLIKVLLQEFDGSQPHRTPVKSILFDVQKREMRVQFEGVSFYAKMTPERESRSQIGALLATLKELSDQSILPSQYIDVRVEDRTFVL